MNSVLKTVFTVSFMLLLGSMAVAEPSLSTDVDSSTVRSASATDSVSKIVELDVEVSNTGSSDASVNVHSAVCSDGEYFRVLDTGMGCTSDSEGISTRLGSGMDWINCGSGSVSAGVCSKSLNVDAGGSASETISVEVPVTADNGFYRAGVVVEDSQLGVVQTQYRGINVGSDSGLFSGFFNWIFNFVANIFG